MKIGIASDHRGYDKKIKLKEYLVKKGYEVIDYGTDSSERVNYPEYAIKIGEAVVKKEVDYGITICFTGIGMSIAANKVKGIRCAKIDNIAEAKLAKKDNNANMIAFSSKNFFFFIKDMTDAFLKASFSDEARYQQRNDQIAKYEAKK